MGENLQKYGLRCRVRIKFELDDGRLTLDDREGLGTKAGVNFGYVLPKGEKTNICSWTVDRRLMLAADG